MSNEVAIRVENVSKTFRIPHEKVDSIRGAAVSLFKSGGYEEFKALDNVSFEVKKGEFFGIIGRNGSGKSTLLKILAGIYQADKGKVHINGLISPFLELGIGFNPELSGRDNIYLNATVLGLSKKQIDKKFDSIVKFSELSRFIDQKLKNYSSGMQVRLAFSVSIHANRDILLMDEVLAVGDSNFQKKCINEFKKYKKDNRTILLVTHDIMAAAMHCDRILLLNDGKIEFLGNVDDAINKYSQINSEDQVLDSKNNTIIEKRNIIIVNKIEIFNRNEEQVDSFCSDEEIKIRLHYKAKNEDEMVFGIEIFNDEKQRLYGYHTKMENKTIKTKKEGFVDFTIEKTNLLSGKYSANIGIADSSCSSQYYYKTAAVEFIIKGEGVEKFEFGNINMKTSVK